MLDAGADVKVKDADFGGTALHLAAGAGQEAAVRILLAAGADRAAKAQGKTPMDIARANGKGQIVEMGERSGQACENGPT